MVSVWPTAIYGHIWPAFFLRSLRGRKLSKRCPDQIKRSYGINRPLTKEIGP